MWDNGAGRLDAITDIITHRAAFLIERVISGLSLDFDAALSLLRNHNDFTSTADRQKRDILVAAIDNLVEFAAAQQNSMIQELPAKLDESCYDEYYDICERYNLIWAGQENEDVLYSAAMAAWWLTVSSDTMLTFMTQGDERVRPWHEALEGLSFPKSIFPAQLIPPIEYACRCYLVADGFGAVIGSTTKPKTAVSVHPVFKESLCTGGRIFSDEHPYFKTKLPPEILQIVKGIKQKFYL